MNRNYEVVQLEKKTVAGLSARTNNAAPDMGRVIGGLWESFYKPDMYAAIGNRANDKSLGIYTDYAGDEKDDYTVMVGCEVEKAEELPEGAVVREVPAGSYAKFIVKGHMQRAVAEFWEELWKMDLPRAFGCDFEEYQNSSMEEAEIHIYISLK